jgi:hypothetical protein
MLLCVGAIAGGLLLQNTIYIWTLCVSPDPFILASLVNEREISGTKFSVMTMNYTKSALYTPLLPPAHLLPDAKGGHRSGFGITPVYQGGLGGSLRKS